jgi:ElaB/YqjD/DUF883 family membrane-anchored ribosome-binding protein
MNENEVRGGAGPALAAHSKDASAPGQSPASSATGNQWDAGDMPDKSDAAHGSVDRVATAVHDAAAKARETLSGQGGRAADQAADFIREQPLMTVAVTGAICLAFGLLLARR